MSDQEFIKVTLEVLDLEERRNEITRKIRKLRKIQKLEKDKRENNI